MFSEMDTQDRVEYLKGCLPLKQFQDVTENYDEYGEETVLELIDRGKKVVRQQMRDGRDHWDYLMENEDVEKEFYPGESCYRKYLYYSSAMGNSLLETHPIPVSVDDSESIDRIRSDSHDREYLEQKIIDENGETVKRSLSEVGRDIWNSIDQEPEVRFIEIEDRNHIYLEFWVQAKKDREFHERRGEFIEFPDIRKVFCRLHLDESMVEIRGRNERKRDREDVMRFVENLFGENVMEMRPTDINIQDSTIREFRNLPGFVKVPHAGKDGRANSNWTSDSDVREDPEFPVHRDNNYSNMVFQRSDLGRVSFQLSAEDDSFRIFSQKITPKRHRKVVEFIWDNIHAPNN